MRNVSGASRAFRGSAPAFVVHSDASPMYDNGAMPKWFHAMFSTYGTWLPGDPRGFRSRKHRIHSSGDYRHPPPVEEHAKLRDHVGQRMPGEPITLNPQQRRACGEAIVAKLLEKGCEFIALAIGGQHVHLELRAESRAVKRLVGFAKQHASHRLRHELPGTIWGGGCHVTPIQTREHQVRVFRYLQRHAREGAFVWTIQDGRAKAVGASEGCA